MNPAAWKTTPTYKRRRVMKTRSVGTQTSKQQKKQRRRIKKIALDLAETKCKIIGWDESGQNTRSFQSFSLNELSQGDTQHSRDGAQIIGRGFHLKGYIFNSSHLEPVHVRVLLLKSKRGVEGNVTAGSEIFTDGTNKYSFNNIAGKALYFQLTNQGILSKWTMFINLEPHLIQIPCQLQLYILESMDAILQY